MTEPHPQDKCLATACSSLPSVVMQDGTPPVVEQVQIQKQLQSPCYDLPLYLLSLVDLHLSVFNAGAVREKCM